MTKRVAWFTGQATKGLVTPHKVYDIFNEDENSFNLKDDNGGTRLCLKQGCAHICQADWVFADIVEEVDTATKKTKKWSKWLPHTTNEQPVADDVIVKVKFCDGTKCKEEAGSWGWFKPKHDGDGAIRFYKVKLKDLDKIVTPLKPKSKWTKNTGTMPVDGDVKVEFKRRDGCKFVMAAEELYWKLDGDDLDIIKWRLAK